MSVFTVDPDRLAEITYLAKGAHDATDDEKSLLEAVAYVAGLPHSDRPACVSPVLALYGRRLNDVLPDGLRQELVPLVPRLVGTAGDGLDEQRGYLALDWLIRTYTPAWLELAGLASEASALRELGRIVDLESAERAKPVVLSSREKATAAGAAARDARAAARAALAPTVTRLQRSAIELFDRMITAA